jgi:hypothetical protein
MERNRGSRSAAWAATVIAAVMLTWGALQVVQEPAGADLASGARVEGPTATGEPGRAVSSDGDIVPTTDASSPVSRGGLSPSEPVPPVPGDAVPPVPGEPVPGQSLPGASDSEPAVPAPAPSAAPAAQTGSGSAVAAASRGTIPVGRTISAPARPATPEPQSASRPPAVGEQARWIGHQVRLHHARSARQARRLVLLRHRAAWTHRHRAASAQRRGISRR